MTPSFLAPAIKSSAGAAPAEFVQAAAIIKPSHKPANRVNKVFIPILLCFRLTSAERLLFRRLVVKTLVIILGQIFSHRRSEPKLHPQVQNCLKPREIQSAAARQLTQTIGGTFFIHLFGFRDKLDHLAMIFSILGPLETLLPRTQILDYGVTIFIGPITIYGENTAGVVGKDFALIAEALHACRVCLGIPGRI